MSEKHEEEHMDTQEQQEINVNLLKCPDCGNMISKLAKTCPHCGRPIVEEAPQKIEVKTESNNGSSGCLVVIGIVMLILAIYYGLMSLGIKIEIK